MSHRAPTKTVRGLRPPPGNVGGAASRALTWSFLNTAVGRFGTVGVGIFLARVLGPGSFGTFAVASVALAAILSFNELGVSLAIIRWPGDPRVIAPTVNTIAVTTSALLAVAGFFGAPYFAAAMGDPAATSVVRLMLVSVILDGAASTPAALLQREFKGGRRAAIDQVNVWLGAALSVGCALAGLGALSLAIGRLSGSVTSALMFVLSSPLPYRFGFDRAQARALLKFGLPLAGSSIFVFAIGFGDQLVVGSLLGTKALGYYVLAFNLASWPVNMFSQPLRNVAPAAFARLRHDMSGMNGALKSTIGLMGGLTIPICLVIAASSMSIVSFVYGTEWAPSADVLRWLAVMALFRIFFELAYDFLVVLGRSVAILMAQIVWLVALVPALVVGAHLWGLVGVSVMQVVVAAVVVTPLYLTQFRRVGLPSRDIGARLWLPIGAGVLAAAVALMASAYLTDPLPACVVAGVLAVATAGSLLHRDRRELTGLRALGS